MAFTKQLPEWNAIGVEPPQSLKEGGWKAGVKPPADYFNWLQNKAFKAIEELQLKAGEIKTINGQSPDEKGNIQVDVDTTKLATIQALNDHKTNLSHIYWLGNVSGTNTLIATYPTITELKDGLGVSFKKATASTGATTLNINGLGAVPIINSDGEAQSDLKANGVYTVRYADGNFILQGSQGILKTAQISGLKATVGFNVAGKIQLDWTNPIDAKYKGVVIRYKLGSYPTNPTDGTLFYDSNDATPVKTFTKTGFTDGTTYYIRAFAYTYKNATRLYTTETTGAQITAFPLQLQGTQNFTTSSTWRVPEGVNTIDLFLVGGGGGGGGATGVNYNGGGGGAGGYTTTKKAIPVSPGDILSIIIGSGGSYGSSAYVYGSNNYTSVKNGTAGGVTSVTINDTQYKANGGNGGTTFYTNGSAAYPAGGSGGSGGGGGGAGSSYITGSGGSNGSGGSYGNGIAGTGQGTTTYAFGESTNTLYAGGGAGGYNYNSGHQSIGGTGGGGNGASSAAGNGFAGTPNTGGGGGGGSGYAASFDPPVAYNYNGGNGGSGTVIVRWGY